MEYFFSIIIPTLNEEKYLPTLLESLSRQTFRDFEVVLVDGRSEDKTEKVFTRFIKKLPATRFFVTDKRNVSFQRNFGAGKAGGKYLVFLDADVDVGETFMEELHLSAVKKKFKLATTYIIPDSQKESDRVMIALSNVGQEIAKIINKPFLGEYNTIMERVAYLKLKGFREDVTISEGHDLAIRALKKGIETVILPEPKVVMSLRRFKSEGTLSVLRKSAQALVYTILKGPITHKMFEYNMGGHVHSTRRKKVDLMKAETYIKAIGKLEEKINNLLGDSS